ncbi:MAG: hypothetical protein MZV63_20470 [Marinilabiliales bacterium]|nr:hypothetical protein [Marinilabiliales bacterium]
MLIIAFFPLLVLLAQPCRHIQLTGIPVIIIGIAGASPTRPGQPTSFYSIGDMFPKSAVAPSQVSVEWQVRCVPYQ